MGPKVLLNDGNDGMGTAKGLGVAICVELSVAKRYQGREEEKRGGAES